MFIVKSYKILPIVAVTNARCLYLMLSQPHLHCFRPQFYLRFCATLNRRFSPNDTIVFRSCMYIMQFILAMLPCMCILFFHTVVTARKPPSTGRMKFRH